MTTIFLSKLLLETTRLVSWWQKTLLRGSKMLVGYAQVSTQGQDTDLQRVALEAAGCGRLFVEKASGAQRERPGIDCSHRFMREGDALVVWKLDRLARPLKQLIETVEGLEAPGHWLPEPD